MLRRVWKTVTALGVSQLIHLGAQLALPPFFIASYGTEGYALWLLLSAITSHFGALDFGLQSYLANELTFLRHRGEMTRFAEINSTGFLLAGGLVSMGAIVSLAALATPAPEWLGMSQHPGAAATLMLLAMQALLGIAFGQYNALFRVLGEAHRGVQLHNSQRLSILILTLILAWRGAPFWTIAMAQAGCGLAALWLVLRALRETAPWVLPRWDRFSRGDARRIASQSLYFGLFNLNQVLVFQGPILALTVFATPAAVVAFSVGRTLFSFVRQIANVPLAALAPEITRMVGQADRAALAKTYAWTESSIAAVSLIASLLIYLAAPWLLNLWLGRADLFVGSHFLMLMLASLALLTKETKLYFQMAANEHVRAALATFGCYCVAGLLAAPAIAAFGVAGLLLCWLAAELAQIAFLHRCNNLLIGAGSPLNARPLLKLLGAASVLAMVLWAGLPTARGAGGAWPFAKSLALLIATIAAVCALFDLRPMLQYLAARLKARLNIPATATLT